MMKKFQFLIYVLAIVGSTFGINYDWNPFDSKIGVESAQAQEACSSGYEITAGQTGPISVAIRGPFASQCKGAVISNITGVSFDSQYVGSISCSNGMGGTEYVTKNYDATQFPTNVALPETYTAYVSAVFDSGGECEEVQGTVEITVNPATPTEPGYTCSITTNNATIDPGGTTTFNVRTNVFGGFSDNISYAATVSPNLPDKPTLVPANGRFVHSNPYPVKSITVKTTADTSPREYVYLFKGVGENTAKKTSCTVKLVVNSGSPDFFLDVTPSKTISPNGNVLPNPPYKSNIGADVHFDVFADCVGGFSGPVKNLTAEITFTGATVSLGSTTLECGRTTPLTVRNTSSIPESQLSTFANIIAESIIVKGKSQ